MAERGRSVDGHTRGTSGPVRPRCRGGGAIHRLPGVDPQRRTALSATEWAAAEGATHPVVRRDTTGAAPIISLANTKGGTGKTTSAVFLSASLSYRGIRPLLVDADPQGSASAWVYGAG
ncbi:AAA family ATPase [Rhodococcoides kroppenstedtii]|uniref:AAA family ATPase n=1 Tax=Rhodococcoides kroppenstedtii TaxID=293050 RepID=UPI00362AEDE8